MSIRDTQGLLLANTPIPQMGLPDWQDVPPPELKRQALASARQRFYFQLLASPQTPPAQTLTIEERTKQIFQQQPTAAFCLESFHELSKNTCCICAEEDITLWVHWPRVNPLRGMSHDVCFPCFDTLYSRNMPCPICREPNNPKPDGDGIQSVDNRIVRPFGEALANGNLSITELEQFLNDQNSSGVSRAVLLEILEEVFEILGSYEFLFPELIDAHLDWCSQNGFLIRKECSHRVLARLVTRDLFFCMRSVAKYILNNHILFTREEFKQLFNREEISVIMLAEILRFFLRMNSDNNAEYLDILVQIFGESLDPEDISYLCQAIGREEQYNVMRALLEYAQRYSLEIPQETIMYCFGVLDFYPNRGEGFEILTQYVRQKGWDGF